MAVDEALVPSKYGIVTSSLRDIPPDEPLFLLRGQDLLAPRAIRAYAQELRREAARRADESLRVMGDECDAVADSILAWQERNPGRTKLPD